MMRFVLFAIIAVVALMILRRVLSALARRDRPSFGADSRSADIDLVSPAGSLELEEAYRRGYQAGFQDGIKNTPPRLEGERNE